MSTIESGATHLSTTPSVAALSGLEKWLPTLLSVIAGMVNLTGFLSLGNLFTAHITGNLVVVGAPVVRRGRINPAQILVAPDQAFARGEDTEVDRSILVRTGDLGR